MILMFGDVHGNFKHIFPIVVKEKPNAIILLGDIEPSKPLEKELEAVMSLTDCWFIHGNHDTDTEKNYKNLFESQMKDRNLHGRVELIDGLRVAGLGGIFRGEIWYPQHGKEADLNFDSYDEYSKHLEHEFAYRKISEQKKNGQLLTHKSTIFYEDYLTLECSEADILVCHEAPSCHKHGFHAIDQLAGQMKVEKVFHGHHHDRVDYSSQFQKLGFEAYGVGFCGVSDCKGNLIKKGDFDAYIS